MNADTVTMTGDWDSAIGRWTDCLRARGVSAGTLALRRNRIRWLATHCHVDDPRALDRVTLLRLIAAQPWAPESRKVFRSSFRSFTGCIVDCAGMDLPAGVTDWLPPVRVPPPRPRPVDDGALAALLTADDPRVRLMGRLAAGAGLRRAEVAALRREDLIPDGPHFSLRIVGKGGRQRIVPVTDTLAVEMLSRDPGFLFPGRHDGHLCPTQVGKLVSSMLPAGVSMHGLRHRYASRGYAATRNLRAVQEALGHASVATTQRYTLVSSRDIRDVSEAAAS